MATVVYHGSDIKLNLNIEPIDGVSMESYDFSVEVYCDSSATAFGMSKPKTITLTKEDTIMVDKDNALLPISTSLLNTGKVFVKVTAYIPDGDFKNKDQKRTEIVYVNTGVEIKERP